MLHHDLVIKGLRGVFQECDGLIVGNLAGHSWDTKLKFLGHIWSKKLLGAYLGHSQGKNYLKHSCGKLNTLRTSLIVTK